MLLHVPIQRCAGFVRRSEERLVRRRATMLLAQQVDSGGFWRICGALRGAEGSRGHASVCRKIEGVMDVCSYAKTVQC